jgi:hypothetical protein
LAHPEEIRGDGNGLAAVGLLGLDGPEIGLARPARTQDAMLVADVFAEIVLLDHLVHIGTDFGGGRDRRPDPRLEAIAESVEIGIGADARIFVRPPRAAERFLHLQDHEARARHLLGQLIGAAYAGDAGADDQHVEMLGCLRGGSKGLAGGFYVHRPVFGFPRIWHRLSLNAGCGQPILAQGKKSNSV